METMDGMETEDASNPVHSPDLSSPHPRRSRKTPISLTSRKPAWTKTFDRIGRSQSQDDRPQEFVPASRADTPYQVLAKIDSTTGSKECLTQTAKQWETVIEKVKSEDKVSGVMKAAKFVHLGRVVRDPKPAKPSLAYVFQANSLESEAEDGMEGLPLPLEAYAEDRREKGRRRGHSNRNSVGMDDAKLRSNISSSTVASHVAETTPTRFRRDHNEENSKPMDPSPLKRAKAGVFVDYLKFNAEEDVNDSELIKGVGRVPLNQKLPEPMKPVEDRPYHLSPRAWARKEFRFLLQKMISSDMRTNNLSIMPPPATIPTLEDPDALQLHWNGKTAQKIDVLFQNREMKSVPFKDVLHIKYNQGGNKVFFQFSSSSATVAKQPEELLLILLPVENLVWQKLQTACYSLVKGKPQVKMQQCDAEGPEWFESKTKALMSLRVKVDPMPLIPNRHVPQVANRGATSRQQPRRSARPMFQTQLNTNTNTNTNLTLTAISTASTTTTTTTTATPTPAPTPTPTPTPCTTPTSTSSLIAPPVTPTRSSTAGQNLLLKVSALDLSREKISNVAKESSSQPKQAVAPDMTSTGLADVGQETSSRPIDAEPLSMDSTTSSRVTQDTSSKTKAKDVIGTPSPGLPLVAQEPASVLTEANATSNTASGATEQLSPEAVMEQTPLSPKITATPEEPESPNNDLDHRSSDVQSEKEEDEEEPEAMAEDSNAEDENDIVSDVEVPADDTEEPGLYYKSTMESHAPVRVNLNDPVVRLRTDEERTKNGKRDKLDLFDGPWRIVEFDLPKKTYGMKISKYKNKLDGSESPSLSQGDKVEMKKMLKTKVKLGFPKESSAVPWVELGRLVPIKKLEDVRNGKLHSSCWTVSEDKDFRTLQNEMGERQLEIFDVNHQNISTQTSGGKPKGVGRGVEGDSDEDADEVADEEVELPMHVVEIKSGIFVVILEADSQAVANGDCYLVEKLRLKRLRLFKLNSPEVRQEKLKTDTGDPWVKRLLKEMPKLAINRVVVSEYKVHWAGWPDEDDTWTLGAGNIHQGFIDEYHALSDPLRGTSSDTPMADPTKMVFEGDLPKQGKGRPSGGGRRSKGSSGRGKRRSAASLTSENEESFQSAEETQGGEDEEMQDGSEEMGLAKTLQMAADDAKAKKTKVHLKALQKEMGVGVKKSRVTVTPDADIAAEDDEYSMDLDDQEQEGE